MLTVIGILDRAKAMGYSDTAIAREVGVTKQAVSRWRKGQGRPADIHAAGLARIANLPATAVLTAIVAAKSEGKEKDVWVRAYGELARVGLAAAAGVAVISDCILCKAPAAQEGAAPASRWASRLSGRVKQQLSALQTYAIWRIQTIVGVTLPAGCSRHGSWPYSRAASPGGSWPTLAWTPA